MAQNPAGRNLHPGLPNEVQIQIFRYCRVADLLCCFRRVNKQMNALIAGNTAEICQVIMARERQRLRTDLDRIDPTGLTPEAWLRRIHELFGPATTPSPLRTSTTIFNGWIVRMYMVRNRDDTIPFDDLDDLFTVLRVFNDEIQHPDERHPRDTSNQTDMPIFSSTMSAIWNFVDSGLRREDALADIALKATEEVPSASVEELLQQITEIYRSPLTGTRGPSRSDQDWRPEMRINNYSLAFIDALGLPLEGD